VSPGCSVRIGRCRRILPLGGRGRRRRSNDIGAWHRQTSMGPNFRSLIEPDFCRQLPMPIIAGSANAAELAHALDSDLALRPRRRHRPDDFVDAVPPGALLRRRCSVTGFCGLEWRFRRTVKRRCGSRSNARGCRRWLRGRFRKQHRPCRSRMMGVVTAASTPGVRWGPAAESGSDLWGATTRGG